MGDKYFGTNKGRREILMQSLHCLSHRTPCGHHLPLVSLLFQKPENVCLQIDVGKESVIRRQKMVREMGG